MQSSTSKSAFQIERFEMKSHRTAQPQNDRCQKVSVIVLSLAVQYRIYEAGLTSPKI